MTMYYMFVYGLQSENTIKKVQTISETVASKLSEDCQCSISAAYISAAQFLCDPKESKDIIFRAQLSSTSAVSNLDLVIILQEWVASGRASVTMNYIQFNFDVACKVLLQSFSDPICPSSVVTSETPTTVKDVVPQGSSAVNIVWPIVGAIVGGVVLILVVIIAIQIFNQCRKSRKYTFGYVYFKDNE